MEDTCKKRIGPLISKNSLLERKEKKRKDKKRKEKERKERKRKSEKCGVTQ